MKDFDINYRVELAVQNFHSGYNCAQSVFLAYCDIFDIDFELAKKISVSFGGGLGRMREVCGVVSAVSMLVGFKYPVVDIDDEKAKNKNHEMVQKIAGLFKEKNDTIICRNLLRNAKENEHIDFYANVSKPDYYKRRPCSKLVHDAAYIAGIMLKGELE